GGRARQRSQVRVQGGLQGQHAEPGADGSALDQHVLHDDQPLLLLGGSADEAGDLGPDPVLAAEVVDLARSHHDDLGGGGDQSLGGHRLVAVQSGLRTGVHAARRDDDLVGGGGFAGTGGGAGVPGAAGGQHHHPGPVGFALERGGGPVVLLLDQAGELLPGL